MMKTVTFIPKKFAGKLLEKQINANFECYYLNDDIANLVCLRKKFLEKIDIKSLGSLFDETYQEIKSDFVRIISDLNKKHNSYQWWLSSLSSRNLGTTTLYLNATYLFCAKKIMSSLDKNIVFIVDSPALVDSLGEIATDLGYEVVKNQEVLHKVFKNFKRWLMYCFGAVFFLWESLKSRIVSSILLDPIKEKKTSHKKRVVIRTWLAIEKAGELKDRVFGPLAEWLQRKDYEVYILPMFYYLTPARLTYKLIKEHKLLFLIPDHYLKLGDYFKLLFDAAKFYSKDIGSPTIQNISIKTIFIETLRNEIFNSGLLKLNLCYAMLKRLQEKEIEIDAFHYSFENNSLEKVFIAGCREFFPKSKIVGFQHTTFFPNQLSYQLAEGEIDYHPLPDEIVCSGPIYSSLHKKAGFPESILTPGPNLRFGSAHSSERSDKDSLLDKKRIVMVPVSGIINPVFELFIKISEVLRGKDDYKVVIRSHPLLLPRNRLIKFLDDIGLKNYEFADDGVLQDWLTKAHVSISSGWSITAVESAAFGVPVIRVIPDNTFNCDPLVWPQYPLEAVNSCLDIKKQFNQIDQILSEDKDAFKKIGNEILSEFFQKPDDQNMKDFL